MNLESVFETETIHTKIEYWIINSDCYWIDEAGSQQYFFTDPTERYIAGCVAIPENWDDLYS